jgi:hypothetical protein
MEGKVHFVIRYYIEDTNGAASKLETMVALEKLPALLRSRASRI